MSSNLKLSIITITFEDPRGLKKTLESLKHLQDSGLSWEHIVVDSSPELNLPILAELKGWPLIRIETPPRGIYSAFNIGIEHAKGDLVWFLNSGDRLKSLEGLMSVLDLISYRSEVDLLCAGVDLFREGKFTYPALPRSPLIKNLIGQNSLCHQGVIYRRTVFNRVGNFSNEYRLAGDYDHHFRCYFANMNAIFSKIILAEYDRDGRSDTFEKVFVEFRKIWKTNRAKFNFKLAVKNEIMGRAHFIRIRIMKSSLLRPISNPLKAIWYKLNQ